MRAQGIDISKHQGYYRPAENTPRPVDFVIQRLSYCMTKDEKLAELTPPVLEARVKGAYHYFSSGAGWKDQCDLFLQLANDKYDFLAWDVEKLYNNDSAAFVGGVAPSLEYLKEHSGKPVLLYINPDTWGTWMKPVQLDLLKFDLWVAHYQYFILQLRNPEGKENYFKIRGAENMRKDWTFWQYDDHGFVNRGHEFGVGSYGLDLDVFNGTLEDLKAWAFDCQTTPPEPIEPSYNEKVDKLWEYHPDLH